MDQSTLTSLAAFVMSSITLALSMVVATASAYESRIQLIVSQLLAKDLAVEGRPRHDVERMLANKAVVPCSCDCLPDGRMILARKYQRLYRKKRIANYLFMTFFLFSIAGFVFVLHSNDLLWYQK